MHPIFEYGDQELDYLRERDPLLGGLFERFGPVKRKVIPDLFQGICHTLLGQQISGAQRDTIWGRFCDLLDTSGGLSPQAVAASDRQDLQSIGTSFRKVDSLQEIANRIIDGRLNLEHLATLPDDAFRDQITEVKGVGPWTADMLLIFSLQRKNIFSIKDLGIRRGITRLYGCETISASFAKELAQRYTPYGTVASFYLWELASR